MSVALRRRTKQAPEQLGLFGTTLVAAEQPHVHRIDCDLDEDCTCGISAGVPVAMTAVEASRHFHGNEYLGFCTQDGGVVCRLCLDREGAVKVLAGRKFFHYLWPPRKYVVAGDVTQTDFKVAGCERCGTVLTVEPCAFRLEPPAA